MNAPSFLYQLTLERVETTCSIHLTWGQGQRLHASLAYPPQLDRLYRDWQRAYLNFYRRLPTEPPPPSPATAPGSELRGRLVASGAGTAANTDWQADLSDFQHRLQLELHRWLRSSQLEPMRQELVKAARAAEKQDAVVDVLITCNPLDLARLPWETWELGAEADVSDRIRMARTPLTIQAKAIPTMANPRRRCRILVILGDDRGLNFQTEKQAIAPLRKLAEVQFIGWEPGKSDTQVKDEIQTCLVDPKGWDALFFAGHSNEKQGQGGELGIAPNGYVRMADMKPLLAIAKQNGLQFALFNSCNGLNLAESLIDLGLSQVIIMREPIHNSVAELFFIHFAQGLAQHKDVHECMLDACQELKTKTALTYPAADLVPSLFRYPNSDLFHIPKPSWRTWTARLTPTRVEAIALAVLLLICWQLPVQKWLIERRMLAQALYSDLPIRPQADAAPPIYLIQIDEASLLNEKRFRPIPRDYLGRLVDHVAGAPAIGIDYLLDLPDEDTPLLAQAFEVGADRGSRFVLGASREQNTRQWRYAQEELTDPNRSISGSMSVRGVLYAELLWSDPLPLSFLLASLHQQCVTADQGCDLQAIPQTLSDLAPQSSREHPSRGRPLPLTFFSYQLGQMWLHPIIDYSLPPESIYTPISSQALLEQVNPLADASGQTLLIAPNYAAAGIDQENADNFRAPVAYRYWDKSPKRVITGGEYHAYLFYQYLSDRFVIPIPDVWMIVLAAIVGKGCAVCLPASNHHSRRWLLALTGSTVIYAFLSLELYASAIALSVPILSPAIAFWLVTWPHASSNRLS